MTRWKYAAAALPAALALALAACGSSNAGVAARVGDVVITESRLAALVDRSLADSDFRATVEDDRAGYLRTKLASLVQRVLLEKAARRLGVSVTDADVDARLERFVAGAGSLDRLREQAAQQGVAPADLRDAVREVVVAEAVSDKLVETEVVPEARLRAAYRENIAEFDRVRVAHILVREKPLADELLRRLREGADFTTLAQEYSTDTQTKQRGGDLGFQGRGATDPAFEKAMFATKPGTVGGPVRTRFGWHLVKVQERQLTAFPQARAELRRRLLADRAEQRRDELLTTLARELSIRINPRFGRWDRATNRVVPVVEEAVSPAPTDGPRRPVLPEPRQPGAPAPSPAPGG